MVGALATLAFGSVRLGYAQSALRSVWVRYQRRTDDPDHDVERALGRLEYHLESAFRPRTDGETRHTYLAALQERDGATPDPRAWRVVDISHRSRYGDGATEADADEAVEIVDDIVR
jgi:creatinine amidohydrolase/Fe(II)-dependent formamide hydrolase-like protein